MILTHHTQENQLRTQSTIIWYTNSMIHNNNPSRIFAGNQRLRSGVTVMVMVTVTECVSAPKNLAIARLAFERVHMHVIVIGSKRLFTGMPWFAAILERAS